LLYTIVDLVTSGADFASFLYLGAISFTIIITLSLTSYSGEYLTHKYVDEITEIYRMDVFKGILNLDLSEMKKKPVGEYLTNLDRDVTSVSQQHFSSMFNLVSHLFTLAIAIGVAFAFNYIVTLFILAISLLIVLVPQLFVKKIFTTYDEYSLSMGKLSKYLENFLNGDHIVQNCDAIHQVSEIVKKVDRSVLKNVNRHWKIISIDNNVVLFLTIILKFFTVFIACLLNFYHMATIAICVAFLQLSSSIYNPLIYILSSYALMKGVKKVVERLSVFGEKEKKPLYESKIRTPSINLRNLTIAYDKREVLNDVTYDFDFGKKILIDGEKRHRQINSLKRDYWLYRNQKRFD